MHDLFRSDYLATKGGADALMPETNAQDRHLASEVLQYRD
jgi:hypothetical protein